MKTPENKVPDKTEEAPGLVFPCIIDVKVFIMHDEGNEAVVRSFIEAQLEAQHLLGWSCRESSGGKYLAITARVDAQSRQHIDDLYQCLNDHDKVVMLI